MVHQTSDGGNGRIVVDQSDLGHEAMGEITSSKVLEEVDDWWYGYWLLGSKLIQ